MKWMLAQGIGKSFNIRLIDGDFLHDHTLVLFDEAGVVFNSKDNIPVMLPWTSIVLILKNTDHETPTFNRPSFLPPSA
jgi:hypothetical protein